MKFFLLILFIFLTSSCVNKNAKLVGNRANLYGAWGQKVEGDSNSVSVWNIWNASDGKHIAEQHCQKYNKIVVSMSFSGITGYYNCGLDPNYNPRKILDNPNVKNAISKITKCIREKIIIYDDLKSDAKTIADGVSQVCSKYFDNFADIYISKLKGASEWEYSYKNEFKNKFLKIQADQTLPFVLEWRSLIRNGWNKKKKPLKKDMPDNLFRVSI